MDMGFSRPQAEEALMKSGGDPDLAAEKLMTQVCQMLGVGATTRIHARVSAVRVCFSSSCLVTGTAYAKKVKLLRKKNREGALRP